MHINRYPAGIPSGPTPYPKIRKFPKYRNLTCIRPNPTISPKVTGIYLSKTRKRKNLGSTSCRSSHFCIRVQTPEIPLKPVPGKK